jgi:hypothetical protein
MNIPHWYPRLIRGLCEEVGIADWKTVEGTLQLEIAGHTAVLFPEDELPDSLAVLIELMPARMSQDPALLQRLLESNTAVGGALGCFGFITERGTVAYRFTVQGASTLSGVDLASRMVDAVPRAMTLLHAVLASCRPVSNPAQRM